MAMSIEWNQGYVEGQADARKGFDELQEVRKIACALIRNGSAQRRSKDYADNAWAIWRAIKAGQEAGKP